MDRLPEIALREPGPDDEFEFIRAARSSRELHGEWISPPASAREFVDYLERCEAPDQFGFLITDASTGELAGYATISNIVRKAFQSGYLGFAAFTGGERRGLMTAGLAAVVDRAFGPLGLHRVEANVQPGNDRSRSLVERLGFRLEGTSPRYLFIAGEWRDHDRWAITAEEWPARRPAA